MAGKLFKWPPKEAQAFSKAIQERFKARTPKGRQDHYLRLTDGLSSFTLSVPFSNKTVAEAIVKLMNKSPAPPNMEVVSKPKLEEGGYIKS